MTNPTLKTYKTAPLPFQGQKRNFLRHFQEAINTFEDATIFIDLFGGSGLLAHNTKHHKPDARVIYNDFDNYAQRIENIPRTNLLLAKFREITKDLPRKQALSADIKAQILEVIKEEESTGFVDYITISSSLLFSMKYVLDYDSLAKETFYNKVRLSDYTADEYLNGLEIVSEDYKALFERFKNEPNAVFILDPPYLSTDVGTYKNYWKLADYLDVALCLKDTNYIYFTSEKSHIIDLCDWIEHNQITISPFASAQYRELNRTVNYNSGYRDMMFFKQRKNGI